MLKGMLRSNKYCLYSAVHVAYRRIVIDSEVCLDITVRNEGMVGVHMIVYHVAFL